MMTRRIAYWSIVVALIFSSRLSTTSAADSKWQRDELVKFFRLGWDLSPEARIKVDEQYDELVPLSKGDGRLQYAMALIKIKQLKYQEALKLVNEIVAADKMNLNAWQAKIWLTVLTKNYSQALVDLEKAGQAMPPVDTTDDKNNEAYREMATFMGRVFGYLEGPAGTHTNEDERIAQRKKMVARLSPERRKAFENGREAVSDKYLALTDQAIVSKERAKDDAEEERDEKLKGIDDEQQQLEKRRTELGTQRDKLRGELKAEMDDLTKQDRPLAQQFATIDARATVIRRELGLLTVSIAAQQAALARERDPGLREVIGLQLLNFSRLAANYNTDLTALTAQASTIAGQRAQLQQRAAQTQNNYGRQLDQAEKELNDIQKKANRNVNAEKRIRKPTSADTPESRAKAAQVASFVTYEQFPLEREKQRLLDSFP